MRRNLQTIKYLCLIGSLAQLAFYCLAAWIHRPEALGEGVDPGDIAANFAFVGLGIWTAFGVPLIAVLYYVATRLVGYYSIFGLAVAPLSSAIMFVDNPRGVSQPFVLIAMFSFFVAMPMGLGISGGLRKNTSSLTELNLV